MEKVLLVHYIGATAHSRSVVASIARDHINAGNSVTIADLSAYTVISQDFVPPAVAKVLGHNVYRGKFDSKMAALGVEIRRLTARHHMGKKLPEAIQQDCAQAVESELLTYFRAEKLDFSRRYLTWLHAKLSAASIDTYFALSSLLEREEPDLVLIPNGRTSRQEVARKLAEQRNIPFKFYEMGRARPDAYYLGTTQPHDRISSQEELDFLTSTLSQQEIVSLADDMLAERMSLGSSINTFSKKWVEQAVKASSTNESKPLAVFFTSSTDEFLSFGPMWNIDSWSEQFEAFDLMIPDLERRGARCVMRVHPNLLDKSHRYVSKTIRSVKELSRRHPELEVIWHTSPVNSYDLVRSSTYVITEHSTIGMEASMMGKPVWVTEAAQWDHVADVKQILSPADFTKSTMDLWDVDPSGAKKFAAYWMMQEHPLSYSWKDWSSWNPTKPPFRLKAAILLGKNPLRHKLHLLALEWDRLRNSRISN